jgi:hypothetical protein
VTVRPREICTLVAFRVLKGASVQISQGTQAWLAASRAVRVAAQ